MTTTPTQIIPCEQTCTESEIVHGFHPLAAPPEPTTELTQLIDAAKGGMAVDVLERLVGLMERGADRRAKAEFFAAKAKFHAECPPPPRNHCSQFERTVVNAAGVARKVPRMYADLQDCATTMNPHLAANGFSYRWDTIIEGSLITKTCYLSHEGGHTESATARYPFASTAGCSEAQKYGSAGTYAARDSLISVTGVTSADEDDDGAGVPGSGDKLTEAQVETILGLLIETKGQAPAFAAIYGVQKVADIPAKLYDAACDVLNKRAASQRSKP